MQQTYQSNTIWICQNLVKNISKLYQCPSCPLFHMILVSDKNDILVSKKDANLNSSSSVLISIQY